MPWRTLRRGAGEVPTEAHSRDAAQRNIERHPELEISDDHDLVGLMQTLSISGWCLQCHACIHSSIHLAVSTSLS